MFLGGNSTHRWDGTVLMVTSASGTSGTDLKGEKGDPGKTPQLGVDYWTMEDQLSMFIDVVEETKKYVPTIDASKSDKVTTLTITDKEGTKTATINDGVDGHDGGFYTPTMSQTDNTTLRVSFTSSKAGMPAIAPVDIELPEPVPLVHRWDGTVLMVTSASGASSADLKGPRGDNGISPTITSSKSGKVTTLTITDKEGTKTATIVDGTNGSPGIGIKSVTQTTTSSADDGSNIITVTKTDDTTSTFTVKNGGKGDKGDPGKTPVRGEDYWTMEDQLSMFIDVVEETKKYVPTITPSKSGKVTTLTITDQEGTKTATINDGSDATVTADNIRTALGYTPMNPGEYAVSVTKYGAVGNGSTDDTAAFQSALAANRKVYVPGGTYKLSGELVIRDNCQIELSQDVVLNFTQTSGNCITVNRSATLRGNHATINVPYAFAGHVLHADTTLHASVKDVEPWIHWSPQWKTARYVTDVNICKVDGSGIHQSKTGDTIGTAVYISANGNATSTFMWGTNLSGLRIAGAFEYGIRSVNFNSGWSHEMRLEAYMDACKIGLSLEDSNKVYFAGSIQPRKAADGTPYAKHGIQLIRSKDTELSGSRVWDWNETNSLWTFDKGNINQHIAMYGDCRGTILNDYNYFHLPSGFDDLRELIYTDTSANYDSLIIMQEPFTRWFKPVDHMPYFNDGDSDKRLALKSEQDALFQVDQIPQFADVLATAGDGMGAVYNGIGYKFGGFWTADGKTFTASNYHVSTGYIPCKAGDTLYMQDLTLKIDDDETRIIFFDVDYNKLLHVNRDNITSGSNYYVSYEELDDGCAITSKSVVPITDTAYVKLVFSVNGVGETPIIAVNEEIKFSQAGFLADGIHVKDNNIVGNTLERANRKVTAISSASTDEQYPSAKAVYNILQNTLGEYVNDVAALIGGNA